MRIIFKLAGGFIFLAFLLILVGIGGVAAIAFDYVDVGDRIAAVGILGSTASSILAFMCAMFGGVFGEV